MNVLDSISSCSATTSSPWASWTSCTLFVSSWFTGSSVTWIVFSLVSFVASSTASWVACSTSVWVISSKAVSSDSFGCSSVVGSSVTCSTVFDSSAGEDELEDELEDDFEDDESESLPTGSVFSSGSSFWLSSASIT